MIQASQEFGEVWMARFDLKDAEWALISPLLPPARRGATRVDDRLS